MLSVGALIWVSLRPLIRLITCVGCGFAITKADIFPVVAARGAGQIALKICLPCLLFARIVPAFTTDNIHNLGPLVLVALIYQTMGMLMAWIIKQFFWVPHRFRYGILMAGGWGNYGDIPTSVIMSVTASVPFNGTEDENLAIAYVAAFILVFFITLFPFGGWRLVQKDFVGPDVEDEEVKEAMRQKRKAMLLIVFRLCRRIRHPQPKDEEKNCQPSAFTEKQGVPSYQDGIASETAQSSRPGPCRKHVSFCPEDANTVVASSIPTEFAISRVTSPAPSVTHVDEATPSEHQSESKTATNNTIGLRDSPPTPPLHKQVFKMSCNFLLSLLQPPSLAMIVSIPIAVVTPLKELFVVVANSPIPNAPDGQPPLAFVLDTASFIGAASVPLGLICLGSALARLKVPRNQWTSLPIGAIGWLSISKMVIMPILGVLICQGLTHVGVIDPNDSVLRFVCIFFSVLPTATTQVYLTQVYSGTGSAEHISAFLIPQYILMLLSMTILTAYSISLIF